MCLHFVQWAELKQSKAVLQSYPLMDRTSQWQASATMSVITPSSSSRFRPQLDEPMFPWQKRQLVNTHCGIPSLASFEKLNRNRNRIINADQSPKCCLQLFDALPFVQDRRTNTVAQIRNHILQEEEERRDKRHPIKAANTPGMTSLILPSLAILALS